MLIPPRYQLTVKISRLLSEIESARAVIESYPILPEVEQNIRRKSTLKSSLFSARIEGNSLTLVDFSKSASRDQKRLEVLNILKALNLMIDKSGKDLTIKEIAFWHSTLMKGLIEAENLGVFRREASAIFNSAGIAIYMPPPPRQVLGLIGKMLGYLSSSKEPFVPIRAVIGHYLFEKIHPFLDGNGRVGRILLQQILFKDGYGMKGLLAIEEILDQKRASYYRMLEEPERNITDYMEFMLETIKLAAEEAKSQVLDYQPEFTVMYLLPRREEILNIIKDQQLVNFDQIRRRFLRVNGRTLRYDLKKLQESGLIRKRGITNGVYYEVIN